MTHLYHSTRLYWGHLQISLLNSPKRLKSFFCYYASPEIMWLWIKSGKQNRRQTLKTNARQRFKILPLKRTTLLRRQSRPVGLLFFFGGWGVGVGKYGKVVNTFFLSHLSNSGNLFGRATSVNNLTFFNFWHLQNVKVNCYFPVLMMCHSA